jgi:two-component system sensor histidine kinase QseC
MMSWLLRRTLARRLVAALCVAFGLVAIMLLGLNYWQNKRQLNSQPAIAQFGSMLAPALAELDDAEAAARVMKSFLKRFNEVRQQSGLQAAEVLAQLQDPQGRLLAVSSAAAGAQPWQAPAGVSRRPLDTTSQSESVWIYRADGPYRSLLLAEPPLPDQALLSWIIGELGPDLLLAFPLVLLPIGLAAYGGLRPLRQLARHMQSAGQGPALTPIGPDLRYAELKPLGQAFDDLLARLRQRIEAERAMLHDAAHELRTPMAVLAAQTHLLIQSPDQAARESAAVALLAAIARTSHLAQQLLDLAALDIAEPPSTEPIDLTELSSRLLIQAAPEARQRGLELALEAPDRLLWDGERMPLISILQNLLDNALRYVPTGGRIEIGLVSTPTHIDLTVADNGPGIAPQWHAQVFERFWRGGDSSEPGSGLGLAIVKQAAARLGATIQLSGGLQGRGVSFALSLPR